MSKDRVIVLEFSEPLLNVDDNQSAFSIRAKELKHVGGALIDKSYTVATTQRISEGLVRTALPPLTLEGDNGA